MKWAPKGPPAPRRGRRLTDVSNVFWIFFPIALAYRRAVCTPLNTECHLHADLATSGVSGWAEVKCVSLGPCHRDYHTFPAKDTCLSTTFSIKNTHFRTREPTQIHSLPREDVVFTTH